MKIGMCTEDDKHWNLTERFFQKIFHKKNYGTLKIQYLIFFVEKEIFYICANSKADIEKSSLLGLRQLHKLSYEVLHIEIR